MGKYTSQFRDIDNKLYTIDIEGDDINGTKEFTCGGVPFTTEMDVEGDSCYIPIKCQGATVTMVSSDYPFDIYTSQPQGRKITLWLQDNNNPHYRMMWSGYVKPNMYDMGFSTSLEEIEIECVDGLAVLKEIPYETEQDNLNLETFINIVFKCLKRSNLYKYLYVSDNVQMDSSSQTPILEKLMVTERNFFEEKEYESQPWRDTAMTCYEVLQQVAQFMGYTVIAEGDTVYMLDYDAIVTNNNSYYRYNLEGTTVSSGSLLQLSQSYHIDGYSHKSTDAKVSLDETYNKITVVDEFNEMDSLVEGLDTVKNYTNITTSNDQELAQWRNSTIWLESGSYDIDGEHFIISLTKNYRDEIFFTMWKFYKHPMIKTYHYRNYNNPEPDSRYEPMAYSELQHSAGAWVCGIFVNRIDNDKYNDWKSRNGFSNAFSYQSKEAQLKYWSDLCNIKISNKNLQKYIICLNHQGNFIDHSHSVNFPFFSVTKKVPVTFGGEGAFLLIKGTLIRHNNDSAPFPQKGELANNVHKDESKTSIYANEGYVYATLQWGNKWWYHLGKAKDASGRWESSKKYFRLYYGDPTQETKIADWYDTEVPIYNTAADVWGYSGEEGYYVPMPDDQDLSGEVTLTVYANKETLGHWARNNRVDKKNSYSGFPPYFMAYKDLDLIVRYNDDSMSDEEPETDTVYECDMSDGIHVNEMDEIKFQICTDDDKTPSYSTVHYYDNQGKVQSLDKTYNKALKLSRRQEEHLATKTAAQCHLPRVEFKCQLENELDLYPYCKMTDKTLNNRTYIVTSYNRDYKLDCVDFNLIEKNDKYNEIS